MCIAAKEEMLSPSSDPCVFFPLAAFEGVAENSRPGFARKNVLSHQGGAWTNSASALGIREVLLETRVKSRCTGKERDAESGLDNFTARYDSSNLGRFMSADPLGGQLVDPQTLNKYSYVRNNPLNFTDPTGLYVCKDSDKCDSKQDQAFETSRQNDLNSKDADVVRAAKAYGDANSDNGVNVSFKDLGSKGEDGTTTSRLGSDANGNPRAESDVVINSKASGTALDAAVGHEGSHVADAQDLVSSISITDIHTGAFKVGQDITQYASEQRAYHVTDSIFKSANETNHYNCGLMGDCSLGKGIVSAKVTQEIDRILAQNYKSSVNNKPLTPSNQGGSIVPH